MFKDFKSLSDLVKAFPTEKACVDHLRAIRWPDGIVCPHCGTIGEHYELSNLGFKCMEKECHKKFSVRNSTIFEDSKLPLQKWFMAIYFVSSHKKGISSCQLARNIGITQKSAWFVLGRIDAAAATKKFNEPISGTFEVDESYLGGKERFKHANKRTPRSVSANPGSTKATIFGVIHRGGDLHLQHVPDTRKTTLMPIIRAIAAPGSTVYSDESQVYKWMKNEYHHDLVKHAIKEYVRGDVTSNRIENAFSHFKRAVVGTYHKVSDQHVNRYLQSFAWRWNRRDMNQGERMNNLLRSTEGRKLTYKQLIGQADE